MVGTWRWTKPSVHWYRTRELISYRFFFCPKVLACSTTGGSPQATEGQTLFREGSRGSLRATHACDGLVGSPLAVLAQGLRHRDRDMEPRQTPS